MSIKKYSYYSSRELIFGFYFYYNFSEKIHLQIAEIVIKFAILQLKHVDEITLYFS